MCIDHLRKGLGPRERRAVAIRYLIQLRSLGVPTASSTFYFLKDVFFCVHNALNCTL